MIFDIDKYSRFSVKFDNFSNPQLNKRCLLEEYKIMNTNNKTDVLDLTYLDNHSRLCFNVNVILNEPLDSENLKNIYLPVKINTCDTTEKYIYLNMINLTKQYAVFCLNACGERLTSEYIKNTKSFYEKKIILTDTRFDLSQCISISVVIDGVVYTNIYRVHEIINNPSKDCANYCKVRASLIFSIKQNGDGYQLIYDTDSLNITKELLETLHTLKNIFLCDNVVSTYCLPVHSKINILQLTQVDDSCFDKSVRCISDKFVIDSIYSHNRFNVFKRKLKTKHATPIEILIKQDNKDFVFLFKINIVGYIKVFSVVVNKHYLSTSTVVGLLSEELLLSFNEHSVYRVIGNLQL